MSARIDVAVLPYRVLIGWLPGVSAKEARAFIRDLADKHFESPSSSGYSLSEFEGGYAYEIQEGGPGRGYLAQVLKFFKKCREEERPATEVERLIIPTQTRKVQIELLSHGMVALQLPESSAAQPTEWLEASSKLSPLAPARTAVLITGAAVFVTGVLAAVVAGAVRYQPYTPPQPETLAYRASELPHSQWRRIASLPPRVYVTNLEFKAGKWTVDRETAAAEELQEEGAPADAQPVTDEAGGEVSGADEAALPAAEEGAIAQDDGAVQGEQN